MNINELPFHHHWLLPILLIFSVLMTWLFWALINFVDDTSRKFRGRLLCFEGRASLYRARGRFVVRRLGRLSYSTKDLRKAHIELQKMA